MTNAVLIQINSQSIVQLINTLDLLKQNDVSFDIIEEKKTLSETRSIFLDEYNLPKKFGKKGSEILQFLAEGCSYQEIAEKADVTVNGVRYYIKKIYKQLGVTNGRDAVRHYLLYSSRKQSKSND